MAETDTTEATGTDDKRPRFQVWITHDVPVLVAVAVMLLVASVIHQRMSVQGKAEFSLRGLSFERPVGFLPPTPVPRATTALASMMTEPEPEPEPDAGPEAPKNKKEKKKVKEQPAPAPEPPVIPMPPPAPVENSYHVFYQAPSDPRLRLEIRIENRPLYNNLVGALSIYRGGRYGSTYWASDSGVTNIGGRDWTRTEFSYAYKASFADSPRVASAIEFASLNEDFLYVVTFHGTPEQAATLADIVSPSLSIRAADLPSQTP